MTNSPAFQFYVKQWLGDDKVMLMDWDSKGMHVHLMCIAWQQDAPCTLPNDDEALKKWIGNPKKSDWPRIKKQIFSSWNLLKIFEIFPENWENFSKNSEELRWVNFGLLREFEKQQKFSNSRSENAKARWDKVQKEQNKNASALQVECITDALHLHTAVNTLPNGNDANRVESSKKEPKPKEGRPKPPKAPEDYKPEYLLSEKFKEALRKKGVSTFDSKWCLITMQAFQRLLKHKTADEIERSFPWFLGEWKLSDSVVRGDHVERNWVHYERGKPALMVKKPRYEKVLEAKRVQYKLDNRFFNTVELEYLPPEKSGMLDYFIVKATGELLEATFVHIVETYGDYQS